MNIISLEFALFLVTAFIIYWLVENKYRWMVLSIANIVFYYLNSEYLFFILFFVTLFSYAFGIMISKAENKKYLLYISVLIIVLPLIMSKYLVFETGFFTGVSNMFNELKIALPLGISFYTFEAISYVVDVYRGQKPEKHFGYYFCFISLFPTITSGPIEKSNNIIKQLKTKKQFKDIYGGYSLKLLTWGLFKKIVIADNIS